MAAAEKAVRAAAPARTSRSLSASTCPRCLPGICPSGPGREWQAGQRARSRACMRSALQGLWQCKTPLKMEHPLRWQRLLCQHQTLQNGPIASTAAPVAERTQHSPCQDTTVPSSAFSKILQLSSQMRQMCHSCSATRSSHGADAQARSRSRSKGC